MVNFREEQLTVPKGTVLGVAQELSECLVVPTDEEESSVNGSEQVLFSGPGQKVPLKFESM